MASVNLICYLEYISGTAPLTVGLVNPIVISSQTLNHYATYSLATATNKVILDLGSASSSDLADFDAFCLIADQDLSIEITGTTTADCSSLKSKANIPFLLGFSKTRAYNSGGSFAGALQDITKITVRNDSGSTSTIRVFAST